MNKFLFAVCWLTVESDWGIVEVESDKHKAYGYRFFADKVKGEGFFITALRKNEGEDFSYSYPQLQNAPKQEINIAREWIKKNEELFLFKPNEHIIAIPAQWQQHVALLQKNLYLRKAGVTVGAVKGKEFVPHHELALSVLLNENVLRCNMNYEQAILYLKKKHLLLGNITKGWVVVDYCDINHGWIKVLHNRINNYYPANWRILKD
jgi:NOL1/NOP2/fmu family ribosome biogenesis protein